MSEKKPARKRKKVSASTKFANGTTYRDSEGTVRKRKSYPKGHPKQRSFCARSAKQKQTEKVKVRRKAWKC